jgi:prevent-host-death family protein
MKREYSTYEAKARFSEILRRVRERGETLTVLYRGEPVAEIRPVGRKTEAWAERLTRLEERGVLLRAGRRPGKLRPIARKPGALGRFLAERNS